MMQRRRTIRVLKWAGLSVCALVLVAWLGSIRFWVQYGTPRALYALRCGGLHLTRNWAVPPVTGWRAGPVPPDWIIWPRRGFAQGTWYPGFVPLWIIFFVLAAPTIILWRLDPRPPKGRCQNCGYDLTGNVSGVCPECGRPMKPGKRVDETDDPNAP